MVLILLSWLYITITVVNFGITTNKLLNIKTKDISIVAMLGLFLVTVAASVWAVFGRIHCEFHLALLLANVILGYTFRKDIAKTYRYFWLQLQAFPKGLKFVLGINAIFITAQCASIPYAIDNESYYIQTIKWLNEFGLVKGLANLHVFLAQTSGWHIAQSAFNFSFLYRNFNDISGFCLLLGNIFAITKLADYFKNGSQHYLIIGLLPLANVLLFQFISAPSPDIPVYIISFMILFFVLEQYETMNTETFTVITIFVLFSLYIKVTSASLIVIPFILLIKHFKVLRPAFVRCLFGGLVVLTLYITKNTITSGRPFFPVTNFHFFVYDYSLPDHISELYYKRTKFYAYFVTEKEFEAMSVSQKFIRWILFLPGLHGLFNKLVTTLVLLMPVIIYRYYNKQVIWLLYFVMCIGLISLALSSPQYRFFLNFVLFFAFLIFTLIITNKKLIMGAMCLSIIITGFALFVPVNLNSFTQNKLAQENSTFSFKNLIFPYKNTKYNNHFKFITSGNFHYYSPKDMDFFWASGDGSLPCVNKAQLDFFKTYYYVIPQMRTNNISDGFYSKELKTND